MNCPHGCHGTVVVTKKCADHKIFVTKIFNHGIFSNFMKIWSYTETNLCVYHKWQSMYLEVIIVCRYINVCLNTHFVSTKVFNVLKQYGWVYYSYYLSTTPCFLVCHISNNNNNNNNS